MTAVSPALAPFDLLAESYDAKFTKSQIGRAQRSAVWSEAMRVFRPGDEILELNCGTGEDAFFLARRGISVLACDISEQMLAVARGRKEAECPNAAVTFRALATERLCELPLRRFQGVFSNFSGLNCVADLHEVARQLALRLAPGAPALLCFSSRHCFWEIAWYLFRGRPFTAMRRFSPGGVAAKIGTQPIHVWYPSVRKIRAAFAPWFHLRNHAAVGLLVPPSYAAEWMSRHPGLFQRMVSADARLRSWPLLRNCGDHILLHFERAAV